MVAVGAVGAHSARLWMRAERPGRLQVRWWPDDQAHDVAETSVVVPGDDARDHTCSIEITDALAPLRHYRFRVVHAADEHLLGEGCFETAPAKPQDTPERFSVAVMSCHQPFDEQGYVRPSAVQMLRAARRCLAAHNVKQVFMVGDQIYADYPAPLSLFQDRYFATVAPAGRARLQDCSAEEVRRLY
jgi:alkaline phosphatase D